MKRYIGIISIVILSLSLIGCTTTQSTGYTTQAYDDRKAYDDSSVYYNGDVITRQISVSASATRKLIPDKASISISITTTDKEATKCYEENAKKINATIDAIKAVGIDENNIDSSDISMNEQFKYDSEGNAKSDGYKMDSTINIKGIDTDKVGDVIKVAVQNGSNEIDGIKYEASNYDEAYAQVLNEATKAAKAKAEAMAEAGGSKVTDLLSVSEGYQDTSARYNTVLMAKSSAYADADSNDSMTSIDAQPGTLEINAHIDAIFAIK